MKKTDAGKKRMQARGRCRPPFINKIVGLVGVILKTIAKEKKKTKNTQYKG
jgi:hypothetical protein